MIITTRLARIPEDTIISSASLDALADEMVPIKSEEFELDGCRLRVIKAWASDDGWIYAKVEVPNELRPFFGPPMGGYTIVESPYL